MSKQKCDKCGLEYRIGRLTLHKDELICYNCRRKNGEFVYGFPGMMTLKEALDKVYEVKHRISPKGNILCCNITLPKILAGHKIKIKLVTEDKNGVIIK